MFGNICIIQCKASCRYSCKYFSYTCTLWIWFTLVTFVLA